ncbi:hypothetical protein ACFRCI_20335 [Streptomyces sp. NPDC056638]|uniref:hypothetical protein n=1 Tax=Streptomyces sp. NPDC056638 TaxID=3345887 RepID=UPI00367C7F80
MAAAGTGTVVRYSPAGPDTVLVEDVVERLALSLRPDDGAPRPAQPAPDHLERWLAVRDVVPWQDGPDGNADGPVTPSRDEAAEDICAFDGALSPARTEGLLAALELSRADAARGPQLDFELLRRWQQHVLDAPQPPPFRSLPAFAKGGREHYGIDPTTRARFDACLAERTTDGGRPLPLTVRAARAYLDVHVFHPFDDGNARPAFLVLVFVLARESASSSTESACSVASPSRPTPPPGRADPRAVRRRPPRGDPTQRRLPRLPVGRCDELVNINDALKTTVTTLPLIGGVLTGFYALPCSCCPRATHAVPAQANSPTAVPPPDNSATTKPLSVWPASTASAASPFAGVRTGKNLFGHLRWRYHRVHHEGGHEHRRTCGSASRGGRRAGRRRVGLQEELHP